MSSNAVFGGVLSKKSVSLFHSNDAVELNGVIAFSKISYAYSNGVPDGEATTKMVSLRARVPLLGAGMGLLNSFDKPILILAHKYR